MRKRMKIARFQKYIFEKAPTVTEDLVPDETKFQVFQVGWIILNCTLLYTEEIQVFMDSLFQSFNQQVSMHNFAELSGCVFSWIEEQCKPGDLQVPKKRSIVFFVAVHNVFFPRTWSTQYWDGQGTATEREVKALRIRLTSHPDRENSQCAEN